MNEKAIEKLLNPKPGSKIAAAREFGIDLTLLIGQLRLTPEERLRELEKQIAEMEEFDRQTKSARLRLKNAEN